MSRPPRRGPRLLPALLLAAAVLTGCVSLPDQGPVVTAEGDSGLRTDDPADIVVQPPTPGETASDIVLHFLDAMTASPMSTSVAREYLTQSAADDWDPEREIITYADKTRPFGSNPVQVRLLGADHLDARGSWLGSLPRARSTLRFPVTLENGEWRISRAPDALVVPDTWFEPRFQQVSLYFFDPTATVVVPEPVYLPRGDQLATALTSNLLLGPPVGLRRVYRTFLPPGLTTGLSVPVTGAGVAEIALQGDASRLTPQTTGLMLAQLAWTLRQVPGIRALKVTISGQPVDLPGDSEVLPVSAGAAYDPAGMLATDELFALRDGVLVSGSVEEMRPVDGPMGRVDQGLRSVAVSIDGSRVAGVTASGRVLLAQLHGSSRQVRQVVSGGADLLPPMWDLTGRLWLVDRREDGALVSLVRGGRALQVDAPGITGTRLRAVTVSRDGTRLVAALAGRHTDSLVMCRIGRGPDGRPLLTPARPVHADFDAPLRVRDLGWRTPSSLVVLSPLAQRLSQVRALPIDGSAGDTLIPPTTLRGRMRWLVSSPVAEQPTYVASARAVMDLAEAERTVRLPGVSLGTLSYVG